jgi:hypothetical protein
VRAAIVALFVIVSLGGAHAREARLPVPPIPPAQKPYLDAPVPNWDESGPIVDTSPSSVTLDSTINHRASPGPGLGYAPGAQYQIDRDRRALVLPGIRWRMPFP